MVIHGNGNNTILSFYFFILWLCSIISFIFTFLPPDLGSTAVSGVFVVISGAHKVWKAPALILSKACQTTVSLAVKNAFIPQQLVSIRLAEMEISR